MRKTNKEIRKDFEKENKKFWSDFKVFISRGNVVDMAVGVVVGTAFSKIVSSFVDDIIMPVVGVIIGGLDFTNLSIKFNDASINYGNFIQSIIDFLIVAFCIFLFINLFSKLKKANKEEKNEVKEEKIDDNVVLLTEIRDLLKKNLKK